MIKYDDVQGAALTQNGQKRTLWDEGSFPHAYALTHTLQEVEEWNTENILEGKPPPPPGYKYEYQAKIAVADLPLPLPLVPWQGVSLGSRKPAKTAMKMKYGARFCTLHLLHLMICRQIVRVVTQSKVCSC